jgi:aspartate kinase
MKFGGTSVGDVGRIRHVGEIVRDYRQQNPDTGVVVVLSAMAGETNRLVALAKSCVTSPAPRELDVLLASGEQVTVSLLAMRLIEMGIPSQSYLAPQVRIVTDGAHTNAHISAIDTEDVAELLKQGGVPVIAGFQGVNEDGDITTLGRGGSDITAVAVAAALKAKTCFIYTDVRGVFSTDPRVCAQAKLLSEVSHEEMLEMASLGAKVLHTRSVYFAMRYHVPLVVLSTFDGPLRPSHNGTWIVSKHKGSEGVFQDQSTGTSRYSQPESAVLTVQGSDKNTTSEKKSLATKESTMEEPVVTGITHRVDEAKVVIDGMPHTPKATATLFEVLSEKGVFIDMISQEALTQGRQTVSITVPDEHSDLALSTIREAMDQLGAIGVRIERDIAKVSVVGIGMRYHTGVASRMFSALAREEISIQMVNTSEIKISVLVPRKYWEVAVRALHKEFVET